jgi:hypothetical protein
VRGQLDKLALDKSSYLDMFSSRCDDMKMLSHKVENTHPETRKQVRVAVAKISAALDPDVMDEAADFVEWWTSQQAAHYRQAASGELNPSPLLSAQPPRQRSNEHEYA